jgi:hypothetical protein
MRNASIIRAMIASETLVSFWETTRRDTPDNSHLHTRRRKKLKSHREKYFSFL